MTAEATIEIGGRQATVQGGKWSCADALTARMLTAYIDVAFPFGLGPEYPVPENAIAIETAKAFGGRVVRLAPSPEFDPEAIY